MESDKTLINRNELLDILKLRVRNYVKVSCKLQYLIRKGDLTIIKKVKNRNYYDKNQAIILAEKLKFEKSVLREFLTTEDVANHMGLCKLTIDTDRKNGNLKYTFKDKKAYMFSWDNIRAYKEYRQVTNRHFKTSEDILKKLKIMGYVSLNRWVNATGVPRQNVRYWTLTNKFTKYVDPYSKEVFIKPKVMNAFYKKMKLKNPKLPDIECLVKFPTKKTLRLKKAKLKNKVS